MKNGVRQYKGVVHCFQTVLKAEGVGGFYAYNILIYLLEDWAQI